MFGMEFWISPGSGRSMPLCLENVSAFAGIVKNKGVNDVKEISFRRSSSRLVLIGLFILCW